MSRILDMLKQERSNREPKPGKADPIQEQLAEIYISPTKKKSLAEKKEILLEKNLGRIWVWFASAAGMIILVLAVVSALSLGLLLSNGRININVAVIKEEGIGPRAPASMDLVAEPTEEVRSSLAGLPSNSVEFDGSANMGSRLTNRYLYLVNGRGPGWANVKINFSEPINVNDSVLSFSAKGGRGGENVYVVLKDIDNKTFQSINVAPGGLSKNWQGIKIELSQVARRIDLNSVSQLRLEFGSVTADNPVGTALYIKDLIFK